MKNIIDLRDILILGGLGLLWFGLNIVLPWAAYAVCGAILLVIGIFTRPGSGG
jgi:hypothetical protein